MVIREPSFQENLQHQRIVQVHVKERAGLITILKNVLAQKIVRLKQIIKFNIQKKSFILLLIKPLISGCAKLIGVL